jgi:hypothetical protein
MKKLGIFALTAVAVLAACKKDDAAAGGDSTAVVTDTNAVAPAPVTPPMPTDTTMVPVDSTATDSVPADTTTKM